MMLVPLVAVGILAAAVVDARAPAEEAMEEGQEEGKATTVRLRLPSILASHMVLQHSAPVTIWGWAPPQQRVRVRLGGHARVEATATAGGTFVAVLPPQPPASAPAEITVSSGTETIMLTDVLFGTVVLCAGQSNMGLGVEATENARQVLARAASEDRPSLRLVNVANTETGCNSTSPLTDVTTDRPWSSPTAISPSNYSAACYFLGLELSQQHHGHPFGMITAACATPDDPPLLILCSLRIECPPLHVSGWFKSQGEGSE